MISCKNFSCKNKNYLTRRRGRPLKICSKPHRNAPRGANRITGKQSAKIEDVQNIVEICSVDLKAHRRVVRLIDFRARRGIDLERRIDAPACEVNPIEYLLAVFGEHRGWV